MGRQGLTKRQGFWLKHLQACAASKESLSSYARSHGLSAQAMYVAKGRLKGLGLWPEQSGTDAQGSRFVRVKVDPVREASPGCCQVHFPNGARVDVSLHEGGLDSVLRSVAAL